MHKAVVVGKVVYSLTGNVCGNYISALAAYTRAPFEHITAAVRQSDKNIRHYLAPAAFEQYRAQVVVLFVQHLVLFHRCRCFIKNKFRYSYAAVDIRREKQVEFHSAARGNKVVRGEDVDITYNEERYGSCEELKDDMKSMLPDLAEKALGKADNGFVMKGGQPGKNLADLLRDELRSMGIISEIDIFSFALTEDSSKRLRQYKDTVRQRIVMGMTPDMTDRPCYDYIFPITDPAKMVSDCVPPPLFDPAGSKMPMAADLTREDKDTFKCVCGYWGDVLNFCPNCGRAVRA